MEAADISSSGLTSETPLKKVKLFGANPGHRVVDHIKTLSEACDSPERTRVSYVQETVIPAFQRLLQEINEKDSKAAKILSKRSVVDTYAQKMHNILNDYYTDESDTPPLVFYLRHVLAKAAEKIESQDQIETLDDVADKMYAHHGVALANLIMKRIDLLPNAKGIDIGSRDGVMAQKMNESGFQITATDINPRQNPYANTKDLPLSLNAINFSDKDELLEIDPNSLDIITACNVLHKIKINKQNKIFRQAKEHLKDGGKFILISPRIDDGNAHALACLADTSQSASSGSIRKAKGWLECARNGGWDITKDQIIIHPHTSDISEIDGFSHYVIEIIKNSNSPGIKGKQYLTKAGKRMVKEWEEKCNS